MVETTDVRKQDHAAADRLIRRLAASCQITMGQRSACSKRLGAATTDGFSTSAFFFEEDFGSLELRVARLGSEVA